MSTTAGWLWFHCTAHTYGAWLPGDPRGFRTRHHREHVDGDYRNPPPAGTYADRHARSRALMTQPPVVIPPHLRPVVGTLFRDKLRYWRAGVIALSAGATHVHVLAKMPPGSTPKRRVGSAKRRVVFGLREPPHDWAGEVWAGSSKPNRIKDYRHQVNTFDYILRHADEGGWVWSFRVDPAS